MTYDHLNRRVVKHSGSGSIVYIYDLFGNLIAEASSSGDIKSEGITAGQAVHGKDSFVVGGSWFRVLSGFSVKPRGMKTPSCGCHWLSPKGLPVHGQPQSGLARGTQVSK
jgi:hypothetical protein